MTIDAGFSSVAAMIAGRASGVSFGPAWKRTIEPSTPRVAQSTIAAAEMPVDDVQGARRHQDPENPIVTHTESLLLSAPAPVAPGVGLEPTTLRLTVVSPIRLSYSARPA